MYPSLPVETLVRGAEGARGAKACQPSAVLGSNPYPPPPVEPPASVPPSVVTPASVEPPSATTPASDPPSVPMPASEPPPSGTPASGTPHSGTPPSAATGAGSIGPASVPTPAGDPPSACPSAGTKALPPAAHAPVIATMIRIPARRIRLLDHGGRPSLRPG